MAGEFTNVDVPKRALVAQKIIYQASTVMSVMTQAGIPTRMIDTQEVKEEITAGNPGQYDVGFSADTHPSRIAYTPIQTVIKWSHRPYMITDDSKLASRVPGQMAADSLRAVSEYFTAVRDYEGVATMLAKAGASTAAADTWDGDNANPEDDIVNAIQRIKANSNITSKQKFSVVLPAGVSEEINKLDLIGNVQRTMEDYLEKSFKIEFFTYRPFIYKKTATAAATTTILNGLSTNALVFAQGENTASQYLFNPAAASSLGAPMTERGRIQGRGDLYTQKMGAACLVKWDELASYTDSTTYATNRIQKITGVSS